LGVDKNNNHEIKPRGSIVLYATKCSLAAIWGPMTTKSRNYPTRVKRQNNKIGWIVLDQIRTIDKIRVVRKFGLLSDEEIVECKQIIRAAFMD